MAANPLYEFLSEAILAEAGLLAYWRLGDTGTTATDSSGNARHITLYNTPTTGVASLSRWETDNDAMTFTAANSESGSINYAAWQQPTTAMAVEAIFTIPDTSAPSAARVIIGNSQTGGYTFRIAGGTGIFDFRCYVAGAYRTASFTISTFPCTHHVLGTWDGQFVRLYIDGVAGTPYDHGSAGNSISYSSSNALTLAAEAGASGTGNNADGSFWDGTLDEVALYNTSLSAQDAEDHAFLARQGAATFPADVHSYTAAFVPIYRPVLHNSETVNISETLAYEWVVNLVDGFSVAGTISTKATLYAVPTEQINLAEALIVGLVGLASEDVTLDDGTVTAAMNAYAALTENAAMADALVASGRAAVLLTDITHYQDILSSLFSALAEDTVGINDILNKALSLFLTDASTYTDQIAVVRDVLATLGETATVDDTPNVMQRLGVHLQDGGFLQGTLVLDNDAYAAWVLNTTSMGVSRYTNFPFNSMAGNKAASDDGIYLLEGADDAGTQIDAEIVTGLLDLDDMRNKRIPDVFLGCMSDGRMVLKVTTSQDGVRTTDWYEVTQTHTTTDTMRFQVGKGLRSTYWQFRLTNADGADFNLDSMRIYPVVLSRRIGG